MLGFYSCNLPASSRCLAAMYTFFSLGLNCHGCFSHEIESKTPRARGPVSWLLVWGNKKMRAVWILNYKIIKFSNPISSFKELHKSSSCKSAFIRRCSPHMQREQERQREHRAHLACEYNLTILLSLECLWARTHSHYFLCSRCVCFLFLSFHTISACMNGAAVILAGITIRAAVCTHSFISFCLCVTQFSLAIERKRCVLGAHVCTCTQIDQIKKDLNTLCFCPLHLLLLRCRVCMPKN